MKWSSFFFISSYKVCADQKIFTYSRAIKSRTNLCPMLLSFSPLSFFLSYFLFSFLFFLSFFFFSHVLAKAQTCKEDWNWTSLAEMEQAKVPNDAYNNAQCTPISVVIPILPGSYYFFSIAFYNDFLRMFFLLLRRVGLEKK